MLRLLISTDDSYERRFVRMLSQMFLSTIHLLSKMNNIVLIAHNIRTSLVGIIQSELYLNYDWASWYGKHLYLNSTIETGECMVCYAMMWPMPLLAK